MRSVQILLVALLLVPPALRCVTDALGLASRLRTVTIPTP